MESQRAVANVKLEDAYRSPAIVLDHRALPYPAQPKGLCASWNFSHTPNKPQGSSRGQPPFLEGHSEITSATEILTNLLDCKKFALTIINPVLFVCCYDT